MDTRQTIASIPSSFFHYCETSDTVRKDGLCKSDFVSVIVRLSEEAITGSKRHDSAKSLRPTFAADLCLLFDQVDINNDGILEWKEITGFLAEKSSQKDYIEIFHDNLKFENTFDFSKGSHPISCFKWINEISRVILGCGPFLCCFHIAYDGPKLEFTYNLSLLKKVSQPDLRDKSQMGMEILNFEYISEQKLLFVITNSTTCFVFRVSKREGIQSDLLFYVTKFQLAGRPTGAVICSATASSTTGEASTIKSSFFDSNGSDSQSFVESAASESVDREDCFRIYFKISGSSVILCQDASLRGHTVYISTPMSLVYHKDVVEDLCIAPVTTPARFVVYFSSCSLDGKLAVWDQSTLTVICLKRGLNGGGKKLLYDEDKCQILCSDFSFRVLIWDMKDESEAPLLILSGHDSLITDMAISSSHSRLAAIDGSGLTTWWNWDYSIPEDNETRRLDQFQVSTEKGKRVVILEGLSFTSGCLHEIKVLVSGKRIHSFSCTDKREQEACVTDCLFNPTSRDLVSIHGSLVKIWDAQYAKQKQQIVLHEPQLFQNELHSASSLVTAAEFDSRGRKLYAGFSSGNLGSYNVMNGNLVTSFDAICEKRQGVSALFVLKDDDLVLCGYELGDIMLFDDSFCVSGDCRIRSLCPAHKNSCILAIHASKKSCILLTSSIDGSLRIWNLKNFDIVDTIEQEQQRSFTSLLYLEDSCLIVAGDDVGGICLYFFNQELQSASLIDRIETFGRSSPIIKLEFVQSLSTQVYVIVASKNGIIRLLDLSALSDEAKLLAVQSNCRPSSSVDLRLSRGSKHGENMVAKRPLRVSRFPTEFTSRCQIIHFFPTHSQLSSMRVIESEFMSSVVILTCGAGDDKVCLWNIDGESLGILTEGRMVDTAEKKLWNFPICQDKIDSRLFSLSSDISTEIAKKQELKEEKARDQIKHMTFMIGESLDEEYTVTIPSLPPTRCVGLINDNYDPESLAFEPSLFSNDREMIFGQLQGEENWKKSRRETAVMTASKSQSVTSLMKSPSLNQGIEEQSDESLILQLTREMSRTPVVTEKDTQNSRKAHNSNMSVLKEMNNHDVDNWDAGSQNRLKQDYHNYFGIIAESKKKSSIDDDIVSVLKEEGIEYKHHIRKRKMKKSALPPIILPKTMRTIKRPDSQESAIMWNQTTEPTRRTRKLTRSNSIQRADLVISSKLSWLLKQDNERLSSISTDDNCDQLKSKMIDIDKILELYQSASKIQLNDSIGYSSKKKKKIKKNI